MLDRRTSIKHELGLTALSLIGGPVVGFRSRSLRLEADW
jgi:hypothetical protein